MLRTQSPGLRLLISFADPLQDHYGGIYQAMNWIYVGSSKPQREVLLHDKIMHKRTAHSLFGTIKGMQKSPVMWKHKYLYPLDTDMRTCIAPLAQPYPKRGDLSEAPSRPSPVSGSIPTSPLHAL